MEKDIIVQEIAELVTDKTLFCSKQVLTSDEAAKYMGIAKSTLYKLTMSKEIPHYKPTGKLCFFDRNELEAWLKSNRVSTDTEISERAAAYCRHNH